MKDQEVFDLTDFLPYLLNQSAEAVSRDFQKYYRTKYGMLRTEWRVLFHIGCHGEMTATHIGQMASIHKTKISRAVHALVQKRFLTKTNDVNDRRVEHLALTARGVEVFHDLRKAAANYETEITAGLTPQEVQSLRQTLLKLIAVS